MYNNNGGWPIEGTIVVGAICQLTAALCLRGLIELSLRSILVHCEDNSGRWFEDPLHDKVKPFHNIQPREELSPGDRRVYNQEKTSPEQIQR